MSGLTLHLMALMWKCVNIIYEALNAYVVIRLNFLSVIIQYNNVIRRSDCR
jgi:hypothetical protein